MISFFIERRTDRPSTKEGAQMDRSFVVSAQSTSTIPTDLAMEVFLIFYGAHFDPDKRGIFTYG